MLLQAAVGRLQVCQFFRFCSQALRQSLRLGVGGVRLSGPAGQLLAGRRQVLGLLLGLGLEARRPSVCLRGGLRARLCRLCRIDTRIEFVVKLNIAAWACVSAVASALAFAACTDVESSLENNRTWRGAGFTRCCVLRRDGLELDTECQDKVGPGSVEWLQLTACAAASSARAAAAAAATAPASAPIAVLRSAACASSSVTFAARSDFSWYEGKTT